MPKRFSLVLAVLCTLCGSAFAGPSVPEIDGALFVQALACLGGILYIVNRKQ